MEDVLSDMIVKARKLNPFSERGKYAEKGKCAFCGKETIVKKLQLADTFTANEYIHGTGYICAACNEMYENNEYRNKNWVCYRDEFRFLGKAEIIQEVLKPRSYPFAIYTTRTYKKQGWIRMMNSLNYDSKIIIIECDMEKLFLKRSDLERLVKLTKSLLNIGLTKTELLSGIISKKNCSKIKDLKYVLNQLNQIKYNPNFKWVVEFYIKGKEESDNDRETEN